MCDVKVVDQHSVAFLAYDRLSRNTEERRDVMRQGSYLKSVKEYIQDICETTTTTGHVKAKARQ